MTDTMTAKLAEWEALVEGATEGPWTVAVPAPSGDRFIETTPPGVVVAMIRGQWNHATSPADAEFIAAARTAMPALLGFAREVLELHASSEIARGGEWTPYCKADGENWPCPTVQAARKWLGGAA